MTPEQSEHWKQALNPLDYLDSHALSEDGLREAAMRLRTPGVPDRATEIRTWLLSPNEAAMETWKLSFALRSECALIGVPILYPNHMEALFQRIFVRFAYEALRPFLEWVEQGEKRRKAACKSLLDLFTGCERFLSPEGITRWSHPGMVLELEGYSTESQEKQLVLSLQRFSQELHEEIRAALGLTERDRAPISDLLAHLDYMHQLRLERVDVPPEWAIGMTHPIYTELIANAYLIALEAACPPPEWLQMHV